MNKAHYIIYLFLFVFAASCKMYIPHIPLDKYKTYHWNTNYTDYDIKFVDEGYYQLDVVEMDTVFARKRINYYTTNVPEQQNYRIVNSLFLYFIDEIRFVYSKKPLDSIDIVKDLGKNIKLGIYDIYRYKKEQDTAASYYVDLTFMDSKVKNPQSYQYAVITMRLTNDNKTLEYVIADYPIDYVSRDPLPIQQGPFSEKVLQQERERFFENSTRTFESSDLDFHAQWNLKEQPIKTAIQGIVYDNTVHSFYDRNSNVIKRDYYDKGKVVYTEHIREDRQQNELISW